MPPTISWTKKTKLGVLGRGGKDEVDLCQAGCFEGSVGCADRTEIETSSELWQWWRMEPCAFLFSVYTEVMWPVGMRVLLCFTIQILLLEGLVICLQKPSWQTRTSQWFNGNSDSCLLPFVALGLDSEIGNFEVGKEFDALLINPKASDSPIDLFYGDFVGDISDVSKRKQSKMPFCHLGFSWGGCRDLFFKTIIIKVTCIHLVYL